MSILDVLLVAEFLMAQATAAMGIASKAAKEGRDPTPEESQAVWDAQKAAEARWKSLAPKGDGT